ncbi:MAG: sugar ABC transporter permease [Deinococcota bacterium]
MTPKVASRLRGSVQRKQSRFGISLVIPALLLFTLVIFYPFVRAIASAFYEDTLFLPQPMFTGLGNFRDILQSPQLINTWLRTLIFVVGSTALTLFLGLVWAVILNQPWRGNAVLRSLSLLPWILPSTVVAFLWAWLFNAQYGVINALLLRLNLIQAPVAWLSNSSGAMAAVIIAKTWATIPFFMAFFLAALQTVPKAQTEAARVDGATDLTVLRFVVLPHLRYTTVILAVLGAVNSLQHFDIIYAMTEGGPVRATTVLSLEVFKQAFQNWNMGLASAIGVVWLVTIAVPAFFYMRTIFQPHS